MALAIISLALMYFVWLDVDHEWVPFRAGQMLLAVIPALCARAMLAARVKRWIVVAAAAALIASGLPTTAIDAYNARDIHNAREGPGFRWTLVLTPDQNRAFTWIRNATPATAIVQMEPIVRGRDGWSLIPSFAHRRMAAGLPISLLHVPEYDQRSTAVKDAFETSDPADAWRTVHGLHIAYVYVDATDRRAYPGAAKFDSSPQYFAPVFRSGDVGVYAVR
jgi:hypothetical protein